jgi:ribosome-binding factor A
MESTRLKKVAKLIQQELGNVFQRESKTLFNGAFITVTEVKLSPDIGSARVYLSFFLVQDVPKALEVVKEHGSLIRKKLGDAVRHQLRIIPELHFIIDDSLDKAMRIDELLKK